MVEVLADLRVRKATKELAVAIQRAADVKTTEDGRPLFPRTPSLDDVVSKALWEYKEKHEL